MTNKTLQKEKDKQRPTKHYTEGQTIQWPTKHYTG
jgi:hypothetical protein